MNNEKNKPWMKYWSEEAKNMEEPQESVFEYWYNKVQQLITAARFSDKAPSL